MQAELWAGVDAGKGAHHCTVIDADGAKVLSRRVVNDEAELLALIGDVLALDRPVCWAIDLADGGAALLITLLMNHDQQVVYLPGRVVHRASGDYRGDRKTDAKDAYVIADQARMDQSRPNDKTTRKTIPVRLPEELGAELKVLNAHREDLVADRIRVINRLRDRLLGYFPALERALDYRMRGPLTLLTGYQTPAALRRVGERRLATWLKNRDVRKAEEVARIAVAAGHAQHTTLPGEKAAAAMVARLAQQLLALNAELAEIEDAIEETFQQHRHAEALLSLPGMGPKTGAAFLARTGGAPLAFGSPDRLAAFIGLAPVPRDSGRTSGNLKRPQRYNRPLLRDAYLSAQVAIRHCPTSKAFYLRKRAEGKTHKQAILSLARRRLNVLWALLRDGRTFQAAPPLPAVA
ncbi:IS110 family transposase [Spirillospora sp. NPDC050679]